MERKNKLTLLGIWNVMPLLAWPWFSDRSINHFKRLTGFNIKSFTFTKNQLHHQYFLYKSTNNLFNYFDSLAEERQKKYIQKLCNDYYKHATIVEKFVKIIEKKKFSKLSDKEIIKIIKDWTETFPNLTMVIWFVVLLDIWYPDLRQKKEIKKIGAKARDRDGYLHERVQKVMKKVFKETANRLGIRPNDIYFLFPEEITSFLKRKSVDKPIKERQNLCVTTNIFGKYRIYEGKKAKELLKKFVSVKKVKKEKLLKGLSASSGKVQGRIHKVLVKSEFNKFKKGEILVALQTMVDYVPIMKKSKAILTEFGGMTSHAAIVSRELKKPCIVGISGLTASVKDGDLIEVDANKGIVKMLRRA